MKPHPLHARKRLELRDAAHLVAESYDAPWLDAFKNPNRSETHHYRRQCVKLVEEAVACGDLVAQVVKEGQKPTIATAALLVWLKGIAPVGPDAAPVANDNKAQIIGRFEPPEGDALIQAQELKARKGRLTITEATLMLRDNAEYINLLTAVKAGEIPSYAPGSNKRLVGDTDKCGGDEELFPAELNEWLDANHPHIDFRFPKVGAGDTVVNRRKRAALITEVKLYWPTISDDLRHSDSNGLAAAASLPEHGYWGIDAAINWARERGKLIEAKAPPAPSDVSPWAIATGNLQK